MNNFKYYARDNKGGFVKIEDLMDREFEDGSGVLSTQNEMIASSTKDLPVSDQFVVYAANQGKVVSISGLDESQIPEKIIIHNEDDWIYSHEDGRLVLTRKPRSKVYTKSDIVAGFKFIEGFCPTPIIVGLVTSEEASLSWVDSVDLKSLKSSVISMGDLLEDLNNMNTLCMEIK
jgi:hypothetical protein